MIANLKDEEITRLAHISGRMSDPRSWISNAGHQYMYGRDKSALRWAVMMMSKNICAICGEYCPEFDGDLEHIQGGDKLKRCDCWHTPLTEGPPHTNVQWVHGMFSTHPCHRKKHNREVSWTRKKNSSARSTAPRVTPSPRSDSGSSTRTTAPGKRTGFGRDRS